MPNMNALVVYDTQFGNTEQIARIIASHLELLGVVRLLSVNDPSAVDLANVDLLVIGGPTQGHSARKPLRDWINQLPAGDLFGLATATFDTRLHWPVLIAGSAARTIARPLENRGAHLLVRPESFFVQGTEGPLAEGETERAAAWAHELAAKCDTLVTAADMRV
jgi:flavodoxin